MKTIRTKPTTSKARRTRPKQKPSPLLVRDLMKPIYLFGQHAPAHEWIVDCKRAREKIAARENFYLRVGDHLYFVNILAYSAFGIPRKRIVERIGLLLA